MTRLSEEQQAVLEAACAIALEKGNLSVMGEQLAESTQTAGLTRKALRNTLESLDGYEISITKELGPEIPLFWVSKWSIR